MKERINVWIIEIEIGIAIGIGIEMVLGHEKLDVYRLSIGYVAWVYEKCARLRGVHRSARDQWLRASQSIALNIAEGNGKTAKERSAAIFRNSAWVGIGVCRNPGCLGSRKRIG
mgnify:FL=1